MASKGNERGCVLSLPGNRPLAILLLKLPLSSDLACKYCCTHHHCSAAQPYHPIAAAVDWIVLQLTKPSSSTPLCTALAAGKKSRLPKKLNMQWGADLTNFDTVPTHSRVSWCKIILLRCSGHIDILRHMNKAWQPLVVPCAANCMYHCLTRGL